MDALAGYTGPWRTRAESDLGRESAVELDAAGFDSADDADGRRAGERHSGGGAGQPEHTIAAGRADETGERSADPFRDPAGCGTGGAAVFAGKRIVCHNYKGRGERVFQCAGAAVSVHGGHGFRAIEAARRPGLRFSAVPTERRGFAADAWRR